MRTTFTRAWALVTGMFLVAAMASANGTAYASGDDGEFEMHGIIESLPASGLIGDWVVSGRTVHVTASTEIEQEHGQAAVGAPAEVKGDQLGDGTINAHKVEVEGPGSGGDDGDDDDGDDDGGHHGGGGSGDDGGHDDSGHDAGEIHGTVESLPASGLIGDWVVSGRTVHVTSSTVIEQEHGQVAVGAPVEVHGTPDGAAITATRVEVYPSNGGSQTGGEAEFFGTVESMAADLWVVSGRAVRVGAATVVEREHGVQPGVGSYVKVEGAQLADGSVQARKIEVKTAGTGGTAPGANRSGFLELKGKVTAMPGSGLLGDWTVGGRTVHVSAATRVEQKKPARVGATVEVLGNERPDGSVDAGSLEVKSGKGGKKSVAKVYGTIQSLPASGLVGAWTVSGRTVLVTDRTVVKQELGAAAVGALVEVKGAQQADGSLAATTIEVKDGTGAVGGSGYIEFRGTVQSMPAGAGSGEWVVSGRKVHVAAGVPVRGVVRVGSAVEVEGSQRTDGSVDASKIHLED